LISILYSNSRIFNTLFIDNISDKVNNGFLLINSQLQLTNVTINFTNQEFIWNNNFQVDTGFISINYQSHVIIEKSYIGYCRGAIASFLYATGSSEVVIKDNTIIENTHSSTGYVIYGTLAKSITVNNSVFRNNSQSDISID
jgi:hypothetical protein